MATFVIVHGAFGDGWEWREVASLLHARGHEVFRPSLTGYGERAHLATPPVVNRTEAAAKAHALDLLTELIHLARSYRERPRADLNEPTPYVDTCVSTKPRSCSSSGKRSRTNVPIWAAAVKGIS